MKDFAKSIKTCNNKVGNGSGHWGRGGADVYKDNSNPGISASIRQVGKGFEVLYTDTYKKISGKSVGIYPDKDTARDVAEAVVETEMPDSVKSNYRSKAVNARIGNYMIDPKDHVESLIRLAERDISQDNKESAKSLLESMEIAFKQLKSDKEEYYQKYKEADDLIGKLNKAAGRLKGIL